MANYQDFPTSMWETLLDFPADSQLLFIYLWTNTRSRPSGLYKINLNSVSYNLFGVPEPEAATRPPLGRLQAAYRPLLGRLIEFDENTQEVWVKEKAKHIRKLIDNNPMRKSIETDIKILESDVLREAFLRLYKELMGRPIGPLSQGQGHSQGQEKKKGCGEKEKHYVETPTRDNSNQEPFSEAPPPEFQEMVKALARKKSVAL